MTHKLAGKRVLIVEDDNILSMNLADELAAEGATVIGSTATVTDALDVIASTDLDAAIVDINLSGKAGCLLRLPACPTNTVTLVPKRQNRGRQALPDPWSSLSGDVLNISA